MHESISARESIGLPACSIACVVDSFAQVLVLFVIAVSFVSSALSLSCITIIYFFLDLAVWSLLCELHRPLDEVCK